MLTALQLSKVSLEALRARYLRSRENLQSKDEFPPSLFSLILVFSNIRNSPKTKRLQNPNIEDSSVRSVNILTLYI